MDNNNKEKELQDISNSIHSIDLLIPFSFIEMGTINQFRNSQEKNVRFELVENKDKQFSFVKVIIPDLSRCNITSFSELKAYIFEVFMNMCVPGDKQRLLDDFSVGNILITSVDVFNRIDYSNNKTHLKVFQTFKTKYSQLQILIPNLVNIDVSQKNSVYFNLKNKKTIHLYDEKEKRGKESLKFEFRIDGSANLKRAFKIGVSEVDGLRIMNWDKIKLEPLKQYYNNWVYKIIKAIPSRKKSDNRKHLSDVNELMKHFGVKDHLQLDEKLKEQEKADKRMLKNKRQRAFSKAYKRIPRIYLRINDWIKNNHPDIYKKIYPQYNANQFIQRKIIGYSIIHTFINFNEKPYSCFLPTEDEKLKYQMTKHDTIPTEILDTLSSEEYDILLKYTEDEITYLIDKIKKKYSTGLKRSEFYYERKHRKVLFKIYNTFSINITKLRKSVGYVQNIEDEYKELKRSVSLMFNEFRFIV